MTDVLNAYALERGPKVAAPRVIGCAIQAMAPYWRDLSVANVTPLTCARYGDWRDRSKNTVRRELAVLQAAINWAFKNATLTRTVAVTLPERPLSKGRWLTKHEAALLLRAWLMQSGVLTWQAAEFLAMTEKVLIDTYAHHHPDYMREAAEAISKCGSRMGA